MALYVYKALTKQGKQVSGQIDAASSEAVRAEIVAKNMYPVDIKLYKNASFEFSLRNIFQQSVAFKDLIFFTKQLAVLLRSGVPLLQALELLVDQFKGKLHSILISLKDGIKEGRSLADGLENYPKVFSKIYVQLVRAGEASGQLEVILMRLTEYLERREALRKKVSGALSYPIFQLVIVFVMVVGLMTKVVPGLVDVLEGMSTKIPSQTKFLMALSDFMINRYIVMYGSILGVILAFTTWRSTKKGRYLWDSFMLKVPVVKFFAKTNAVVQFCSTLGMLLESGVSLAPALDIVANIIENKVLLEAIEQAKEKIVKQGKITSFLKETDIFPPMAIYLIKTGEQSGELPLMLLTVSKNYEEELSELTDSLTSKIEPAMLVIMGVIVGFVMWAIMGPLLSSYNSL